MDKLTHFNKSGRAKMVDVSEKEPTLRQAVAKGVIKMKRETIRLIKEGGVKKGDVLSVAQVGGIMAAKNTSGIIPMCHNISLTGCDIEFELSEDSITVWATAKTTERTGVEMEALTASCAALLTIYDMVKSADKDMEITDVCLIRKTGGKSGEYERE